MEFNYQHQVVICASHIQNLHSVHKSKVDLKNYQQYIPLMSNKNSTTLEQDKVKSLVLNYICLKLIRLSTNVADIFRTYKITIN